MESKKKFYLEAPVKVHTYDTDFMGIVSNTVYQADPSPSPPQWANKVFRRWTECPSVPCEGSTPQCDARTE